MALKTNFRVSNQFLLLVVAALGLIQSGCGYRKSEIKSESLLSKGLDPIQLTDANFQQEVIDSEIPVLVDMWAPWCQPCVAMKPTIRELATELAGEAKVTELNIEENPFIREKYEVNRYPMLLLFQDGREVKRIIGLQSKQTLIEAMRTAVWNN
tara:strand:- start:253 stop:714 length:462 start_codon:yes stop_codon:yes gene_type:complete